VHEVTLPPDIESPRRARRFVEEALGDDPAATINGVVALLVSEVVTNAVLHARTEVHLRIGSDGTHVRVEVADACPAGPAKRDFSEQAATGRGMLLVDELADDWGTRPSPDGKVVWFEVGAAAVA
jgi:anti-sigma regulatory factor (Ser/Thr protein kinase)